MRRVYRPPSRLFRFWQRCRNRLALNETTRLALALVTSIFLIYVELYLFFGVMP